MDNENLFKIKIPGFKIAVTPYAFILKTGNKILQKDKYYIEEKPDQIKVIIEIPGTKKENVEIFSNEEKLYVRAKPYKKLPTSPEIYEFYIDLPSKVSADDSKAEYENGILTVYLKKKFPAKKLKLE